MDSIACNKVQPAVRKVKKKQVKGEMDRLRQAEKKRRRLEKALATSAAIRSELEQKKQKKKEEQQRLDEEGAAIAEAVALHVLLGEDSDDSCKILLNKEEVFNTWSCDGNIDLVLGCEKKPSLPHEDCSGNSFERIGWVPSTCGTGCQWGRGKLMTCHFHTSLSEGACQCNTSTMAVGALQSSQLDLLQHKLFLLSRLQKMRMAIRFSLTGC